MNNITTVQTGHPFEVQLGFNRSGNLNTTNFSMHERPNVKSGYTNNPILGGPARYWDINAFELQPAGRRGYLGRNTLIGPGLVNCDVSLAKAFPLDEVRRLDFRAEFFNLPNHPFNLPNHPNFNLPSGRTAFSNVSATGVPTIATTWGNITSTVTTSGQIQFGLNLVFELAQAYLLS